MLTLFVDLTLWIRRYYSPEVLLVLNSFSSLKFSWGTSYILSLVPHFLRLLHDSPQLLHISPLTYLFFFALITDSIFHTSLNMVFVTFWKNVKRTTTSYHRLGVIYLPSWRFRKRKLRISAIRSYFSWKLSISCTPALDSLMIK